MKRITALTFLLLTIIGVSAQAYIIWNFDSPSLSPSTISRLGYFYVYTTSTVAGKGIGGTNALQIVVPAMTTRVWGGGFTLRNANPIDLTSGGSNTTQSVYWSIMANETSTFGVSFEVMDTTGNIFIPPGVLYTTASGQFNGSISTTAFQKITWNVSSFNYYSRGSAYLSIDTAPIGTIIPSRHPLLSAISTMTWIFPSNVPSHTTTGRGSISNPPELTFYLDNVGATNPALHTAGVAYGDWSIFSQAVVPVPKYDSPALKEKNLIIDK